MTYIKFETQTAAYKARDVLSSNNIISTVKRNPNPNRKEGCNYALFVKGDVNYAYEILIKSGINVLGTDSFG